MVGHPLIGQAAVTLGLLLALPGSAAAQSFGCTLTRAALKPERHVLRCPATVPVEIEAPTGAVPLDRDGNGQADTLQVRRGAVYIETPGSTPRGHLQILTPHAIASVRGTRLAVDVTAARTSVFVASGVVAVRRAAAPAEVTLRAGDGVDVDAGTAPLRVTRWGAPRAAGLLARFGR